MGIDLQDALFTGDSITDVHAVLADGIATILAGLGEEESHQDSYEAEGLFHIAADLGQAVEMIPRGPLPILGQQALSSGLWNAWTV